MRWYHFVCVYLLLASLVCLAIIPEMSFGLWFGVICVLGIILGVLGIRFLPHDEKKL